MNPMTSRHSIRQKMIKAESCGNTFLIYEMHPEESLNEIKDALRSVLKKQGRDSGLVLQKIEDDAWKMFVIEKDDSLSAFCGNGSKAVALYIFSRYELSKFYIRNDETNHCLVTYRPDCNISSVEIGNVMFQDGIYYVLGEPHAIYQCGPNQIEELAKLHSNVNVSCIEQVDDLHWNIRTWERGVNAVTKSCGSACVAAMSSLVSRANAREESIFICPGGENTVTYRRGRYVLASFASCDGI